MWINDGYCDDVTNTEECLYDGGDCCLEEISNQFCTTCFCHQDGSYHDSVQTTIYSTTSTTTNLVCSSHLETYIGDGFCDDNTNSFICQFDGGDCCLDELKTEFCIMCNCISNSGGNQNSINQF